MKDFTTRLTGLKQIGFYMAPDHAQVNSVPIPDNIEIVELLTGGEVFFDIDGEERTFGRGTIFWHRAGEDTICRTTTQKPYRCATYAFEVADKNRPVNRISFWNPNAETDLDRFTSECLNIFHAKSLDNDVLCLYIYSTLLRHAMETGESSNQRNFPAPLDRALDYIQKNLKEKITVADLTRASRLSQSQVFKLFQTHLKTTPHQYILSHQLLRAKTMLAGSDQPIKVIASECGFENIEVFYRQFNKDASMPPGQYRQKHLPYHLTK